MLKKTALCLCAAILAMGACTTNKSVTGKDNILIKKYFMDDDTFVIECKGFPKDDVSGLQATETAKEAALLNAQVIAKETFNDTVDVITNGKIEKYEVFEGYAVVTYVITLPNLMKNIREEKPYE